MAFIDVLIKTIIEYKNLSALAFNYISLFLRKNTGFVVNTTSSLGMHSQYIRIYLPIKV